MLSTTLSCCMHQLCPPCLLALPTARHPHSWSDARETAPTGPGTARRPYAAALRCLKKLDSLQPLFASSSSPPTHNATLSTSRGLWVYFLPLLLDHEYLLHRLDRHDTLHLLYRFGATTLQASGILCLFTQEPLPLLLSPLAPDASLFTSRGISARLSLL